MPLVVLLALVLTLGRSGSSADGDGTDSTSVLTPLTLAGSDPPASTTAACAQVVSRLPVTLGDLRPRVVHGPQFAVAWGNPSVVFRCGVPRPQDLSPQNPNQIQTVNGRANWLPSNEKAQTTWSLVDRSVFVTLVVPGSVSSADVLPAVSTAVVAALPTPVCKVGTVGLDGVTMANSCTYRP